MEDFMAENYKITASLQEAVKQNSFAAYCEYLDLAEKFQIPKRAITKAYNDGAKENATSPFFEQDCTLKADDKWSAPAGHPVGTMREIMGVLNNLSTTAASNDSVGYRTLVGHCKLVGISNEQIKDAYDYGRKRLGATWFNWSGKRVM